MRVRRSKIDRVSIENATYMAARRAKDYAETAAQLATDPDRAKRHEAAECPICFYVVGRIGGCAMTAAQCGICDQETMFGNTNTDALCPACAHKYRLCKHCGGDQEMKRRTAATLGWLKTDVQPDNPTVD